MVPIPMVVGSTAAVGNLVWSKDPEEPLKINEQKLKEMGVSRNTVKQLYLRRGFSLNLYTRLAASLREVSVPGCADYAATAAEVDTGSEAMFVVESAETLARFHTVSPVESLLPDSREPVAKTKDGRAEAAPKK